MPEHLDVNVDIEGFVAFMRRLFKSPNVYIRELIQNSLEAVHAALQMSGIDVGEINIETDSRKRLIRVIDNGIGMNHHQLRNDLTRVFKSGWVENQGSNLGIGQFGFGFFSSLLVANEVRVYTKSLSSPYKSHLWRFSFEDSSIFIEDVQDFPKVSGTIVELHLNEEAIGGLDFDYIVGELKEFFLYTEYKIQVDGINSGIPTLDNWQRLLQDPAAVAAGSWLRERYEWDNDPLYVYPTLAGFLVIAPPFEKVPGVEIFRRGIRVIEQELIEPPLNRAICGLFDVAELELRPDRESLAETPYFFEFKEAINQQVYNCLAQVAEENPLAFNQICKFHGEEIIKVCTKKQELRLKIGAKIPLKVIRNGKVNKDLGTSLSALAENTRSIPVFIWTDDPIRDSLIVDRFSVLGQPILLLTEQAEQVLAQHVAEDLDIPFKSVIAAYIEDLRESMVSDSSLSQLFVEIAPNVEVLCCHDADTRLPVRMLALKKLSVDQPSELNQLLRAFAALLGVEDDKDEEHIVLAINLSHPAIQALSNVLARDGISKKTIKTAEVLVFLSKTASQQGIERSEFDTFTQSISDLISMLMC